MYVRCRKGRLALLLHAGRQEKRVRRNEIEILHAAFYSLYPPPRRSSTPGALRRKRAGYTPRLKRQRYITTAWKILRARRAFTIELYFRREKFTVP
jgi:hypothetical protein